MSVHDGMNILSEFADKLPANCRRVVLDIAEDRAVVVYYECYGDDVTLELVKPALDVGIQVQARKMSVREIARDEEARMRHEQSGAQT